MATDRMPSHWRGDWLNVGEYDRASESFRVVRIPAPPRARAMIERDHFQRETRVGWEIRHACPKCLHACSLQWRDAVTDEFLDHGPPGAMDIALEAARSADAAKASMLRAQAQTEAIARDLHDARRDAKAARSREVRSHNKARKARRGYR